MVKGFLFKFCFSLFRPFFIIAAVFTVIIFKPFVALAIFSSQRESALERRNVEILSQNNALEADDDNVSVEDAPLDQQAKDAIETKGKGGSSDLETPTDDDIEDVRNGPDDPE